MAREEGGSLLQPFLELQLSYHTGSPYCNLETAKMAEAQAAAAADTSVKRFLYLLRRASNTRIFKGESPTGRLEAAGQPAEDRTSQGVT